MANKHSRALAILLGKVKKGETELELPKDILQWTDSDWSALQDALDVRKSSNIGDAHYLLSLTIGLLNRIMKPLSLFAASSLPLLWIDRTRSDSVL